MHQNFYENYQLPLRMTEALASELHEVSLATGIQKTKICRMGISRILRDLKNDGLADRMSQISRHYEEIK
jgi:hypothetical protein